MKMLTTAWDTVYEYMIRSLYPEYSENFKNSQKAGNPVGKQMKGQNGHFIRKAI